MDFKALYDRYCFEHTEQLCDTPTATYREFIICVKNVFPHVTNYRKHLTESHITNFLTGLEIKPLQPIPANGKDQEAFCQVYMYITAPASIKKVLETSVICTIETGCFSNGFEVIKTVTFSNDNTWSLQVASKTIDLEALRVDKSYLFTEESVRTVCDIVSRMRVCCGLEVIRRTLIINFHSTLEDWTHKDGSRVRAQRSDVCHRMCTFFTPTNACRKCLSKPAYRYVEESVPEESSSEEENEEEVKAKAEEEAKVNKIRHFMANADPSSVQFFLDQSQNVLRKCVGKRWSRSTLDACLQLYNRSPCIYRKWFECKLFALPSGSTMESMKKKRNVLHDVEGAVSKETRTAPGDIEKNMATGSVQETGTSPQNVEGHLAPGTDEHMVQDNLEHMNQHEEDIAEV